MSILTDGYDTIATLPQLAPASNAVPGLPASASATRTVAQRANWERDQWLALAAVCDPLRTDRIPLLRVATLDATSLSAPIDAADVAYDPTLSGLTATDVQDAIDELAASTGGGSADQVSYDPTLSGLTASDVQAAIDELAAATGGGSADQVSYDPTLSGLTATDVQDAIDEVVVLAQADAWETVYSLDLTAQGSISSVGATITIDGIVWSQSGNPTVSATDGLSVPGGAANTAYASNSTGAASHNRIHAPMVDIIPDFRAADDWRIWVEFDAANGDQNSECCVLGFDQPNGGPTGYGPTRASLQKGFGTSANRWNFGGLALQATQQDVLTARTVGVMELADGGNALRFWVLSGSGVGGTFSGRDPIALGTATRGGSIVTPSSGTWTNLARLSLGAITGNTNNNFTARFRGLRIERKRRA